MSHAHQIWVSHHPQRLRWEIHIYKDIIVPDFQMKWMISLLGLNIPPVPKQVCLWEVWDPTPKGLLWIPVASLPKGLCFWQSRRLRWGKTWSKSQQEKGRAGSRCLHILQLSAGGWWRPKAEKEVTRSKGDRDSKEMKVRMSEAALHQMPQVAPCCLRPCRFR